MATYGFLDVLEEELDKNFPFDFEISWDKRNHAVEVSFLLEAQNATGVEMLDEDGEVSSDDILFEEAVLFYNPAKSTVNADDYLTVIPSPQKAYLDTPYSKAGNLQSDEFPVLHKLHAPRTQKDFHRLLARHLAIPMY